MATYDVEVPSSVPAKKLFKAFILDGDNLIPKIVPHAITSIQTLHGDGGPGTVKLMTFGPDSEIKSVKHRVDAIDEENLTYSYTIIEGDTKADDEFESVSYHVKVIPTPEGGCIMKNSTVYKLKGAAHKAEEHFKANKENAVGLFKAVEGYLHANPHEY